MEAPKTVGDIHREREREKQVTERNIYRFNSQLTYRIFLKIFGIFGRLSALTKMIFGATKKKRLGNGKTFFTSVINVIEVFIVLYWVKVVA